MDASLFVETFPRLYHMAHHESLASIRRHGLLSTSALLDLFEITGPRRRDIETEMRRDCVEISHPKYGRAVIRDQKPIMNDNRLQSALGGSATTVQFHSLLNSMVFFWVSPERLETLRGAVAYRSQPQLVLVLETKPLVEAYAESMMLCSMNSGSCKPMAHPRTLGIFQSLKDYDFESWKKKKGNASKAVVECTVKWGVHDIDRFIIKTEIVGA